MFASSTGIPSGSGPPGCMALSWRRGSEENLGPRHPETLRSANNLAALYKSQGRLDQSQ